jgi:hypothetical protein
LSSFFFSPSETCVVVGGDGRVSVHWQCDGADDEGLAKTLTYWRLASARALPSLPGLARAVLWTVEQLPAQHSTTFSDGQ